MRRGEKSYTGKKRGVLAQFTPGCTQRAQAEAISTQTYQTQGRALQGFVPAVSSQHKPPFCDKISAELIRKACPRLCAHALASLPGQHRILPPPFPPSLAPGSHKGSLLSLEPAPKRGSRLAQPSSSSCRKV